jgi:hypothetical protein
VAESQCVSCATEPWDGSAPGQRRRAQDAAMIALARRELPRPLAESDPPIHASVEGNLLTFVADSPGRLVFAPAAEGRAPTDIAGHCVGAEGRPLQVPLEPGAGEPVVGVVTLERVGRPPLSFGVRIPAVSDEERDGFALPEKEPKP